jgi:hypothetical protein
MCESPQIFKRNLGISSYPLILTFCYFRRSVIIYLGLLSTFSSFVLQLFAVRLFYLLVIRRSVFRPLVIRHSANRPSIAQSSNFLQGTSFAKRIIVMEGTICVLAGTSVFKRLTLRRGIHRDVREGIYAGE